MVKSLLRFLVGGVCSVQMLTAESEQNNVLLLILDDWGVDSSSLYSNSSDKSLTFPPMPNVEKLSERGLRFTNAHAQPMCSPTRAAILTGRYSYRHGVGAPEGSLPASELTLPEVFKKSGSSYQLASFGKWHLGGGNSGPNTLGGWPDFVGFMKGGEGLLSMD